MVIFERKADESGYIAINIECRFTYRDHQTTLESKEILNKYKNMKKKYLMHVRYLCNRLRSETNAWENGSFYDKSSVGKLKMTENDICLVFVVWRDLDLGMLSHEQSKLQTTNLYKEFIKDYELEIKEQTYWSHKPLWASNPKTYGKVLPGWSRFGKSIGLCNLNLFKVETLGVEISKYCTFDRMINILKMPGDEKAMKLLCIYFLGSLNAEVIRGNENCKLAEFLVAEGVLISYTKNHPKLKIKNTGGGYDSKRVLH
ncbi:563_t:CDS:2 [Entrophospora sp. SA101]|nr:563_t:CDS:2 [Entrophospora sp. SA101]